MSTHDIPHTRHERNPVQRLKVASVFAALLLGLAPGGATLAQQTPTPAPFFSSRGRHTSYWRDWSSDVCSSDLYPAFAKVRDQYVQLRNRNLQLVQIRLGHRFEKL